MKIRHIVAGYIGIKVVEVLGLLVLGRVSRAGYELGYQEGKDFVHPDGDPEELLISYRSKINTLECNLKDLITVNGDIGTKLDDVKNDFLAEQGLSADLRQKNEYLQGKLDSTEKKLQDRRGVNAELVRQNLDMSDDIKGLQHENASLKEEIQNLQSRVNALSVYPFNGDTDSSPRA